MGSRFLDEPPGVSFVIRPPGVTYTGSRSPGIDPPSTINPYTIPAKEAPDADGC